MRVSRAAVEGPRAPSAAFRGAAAAHKFAFVAFRTFDAHGDRARVFALRITGAADEFAEAAVFLHQAVAAERTFFIQRLIRLMCDARALDKAAGGLAVGVTGASKKGAEAPALDGHLLAAIVAILGFRLAALLFRSFCGKVLNEIAFGIPRKAGNET